MPTRFNILYQPQRIQQAITRLCLYFSLVLLPAMGQAQKQETTSGRAIDSLLTLVKTDKQDTSKVAHLCLLSKEYRINGNIDIARSEADEAVKLAERLGNNVFIGKAYNNIASVYYYLGVYPDALSNYLEALKMFEKEKNSEGISVANIGIGNVYRDKVDYANALKNYFAALDIDTRSNRRRSMSVCYNDIGIVYWNMKDYKQALGFYLKALEIDQQLNNKDDIATDLTNTGNVYSQNGDTAKALDNYKKALGLFALSGNKPGIAILTGNIGEISFKQKKFKDAEKYLIASVNIARSINDLKEQEYDYLTLSSLYALTSSWQKAYVYHAIYASIRDSITHLDDTKKMVSEAMTYEFQKKELAIKSEQEKKDLMAKAEIKRSRVLLLLFIVLALFALLAALFILRSLKAARREKLIAEQQKSMMELKALRAQMNPHFIFNAINSIQHFILKNDSDEAQKHLNKFAKLIRKVLENSKKETIPLSEEVQMLQLYTELEAVRFSSKFNYKFVVNEELNAASIMLPPLLIQPFVENAIWHGLMHMKEKQGELIVTFDKENNMLKCTIDDNGIGRKRSQEMRDAARHEPMGLSITHERVQILNEVYKISIRVTVIDKVNTDGSSSGTRVEITIPLNLNSNIHA